MRNERHIKGDFVVDAALRRFSHFGIAKTTLTEVAEDLGVTKAALSYYFPDKQSLVEAVFTKLSAAYLSELRSKIEEAASVEAGLLELTAVKSRFFEEYFMLITGAYHAELPTPLSAEAWRKDLAQTERALLSQLFIRGVETGELKPLDATTTGELLLETLYAFSKCVQDQGPLPQPHAFKEVMRRQQEVIRIFYQGLKRESWTA